jgi:hypothetical protein
MPRDEAKRKDITKKPGITMVLITRDIGLRLLQPHGYYCHHHHLLLHYLRIQEDCHTHQPLLHHGKNTVV